MTGARINRTDWIAGLLVGGLTALLFFLFPLAAIGLAILFGIGAARTHSAWAGASGFMSGFGATWLALLIRADRACADFNAIPNQGCVAPDLTGWFVVTSAILASGSIATLEMAVRRRR
jgi:hypothetical protein